MLRIGKLTDYATVILATLAADRSRLQNAGALAERTHIAAPTVSKLLKQLQRAGLVKSTRGTHGGYQLARAPEDISAAAILDALEGPIALTECSVGTGHCCIEHSCSGRPHLAAAECRDPHVAQRDLAGATRRAWTARTPPMPIERELKQIHARQGAGMSSEPKSMENRRAARQVVPARLRHRHRLGHAAAGPRRGRRALHLAQEARAASS